jgi:excisionase family DNA binding protein
MSAKLAPDLGPGDHDTAHTTTLTPPTDEVIDVPAVARLLHVGRNAVYELVGRNAIPHRRLGKQIRFSRAAIMRWLDPHGVQHEREVRR